MLQLYALGRLARENVLGEAIVLAYSESYVLLITKGPGDGDDENAWLERRNYGDPGDGQRASERRMRMRRPVLGMMDEGETLHCSCNGPSSLAHASMSATVMVAHMGTCLAQWNHPAHGPRPNHVRATRSKAWHAARHGKGSDSHSLTLCRSPTAAAEAVATLMRL